MDSLPACWLSLYCLKMAINEYEEQCFSVSVLNFSFCSWQPLCTASCSVLCLYSPAVSLGCPCEGVFRQVLEKQGWKLRKSKQWGAPSSYKFSWCCDPGQHHLFSQEAQKKKLLANVISPGLGLTLGCKGTLWRRVQLRPLHCVVFSSFLWSPHHCCETFLVTWPLWQRGAFRWPPVSAGNEQWLGLIFGLSVHVFFLELVEILVTFLFLIGKLHFSLEKADL